MNQSKPRPLAQYHPSVWGNFFAQFSSTNSELLESYATEVEGLKTKVKLMLLNSTSDLIENITFINELCRLGVSYHFEDEIDKQLQRIFVDANQHIVSCDLYTSALIFLVLRQHGYKMSCDIFEGLKGSDGKFKDCIACDVKGMLSLFEATHVRVHGEDILEEALVFTKAHMESFAYDHPTHPFATQLVQALEQPYHKCMPRLATKRYISFYRDDKFRNETLFKFAVLDFNRVQLLHRQELGFITRWHKELGFGAKLSYVRDRIVEVYFWMQGVYFEPHHSRARIILTKVFIIFSVIDDTYDSYGTYEELECFTNAIQRWDASAVDQLPEYMKFIYSTILDLYEEIENEMIQNGRCHSVNYATDAMKELVNFYHKEAKWLNEDYVPTFDEYLQNGYGTSGTYALMVSSLVGMGMEGIAAKEAFEWLHSNPQCIKACSAVGRLLNDIKGYKLERKRRHVASAVEFYMDENGASEEEAVEEMERLVEAAWKDMNEEWMKPTHASFHIVLMRILNLARTTEAIYKFGDGYTVSSAAVKDYITSLFVHPILHN